MYISVHPVSQTTCHVGYLLQEDKDEGNVPGDDYVEVNEDHLQACAGASSSSGNGTKRRKRDEAGGVDDTPPPGKTEGEGDAANNESSKEDEEDGGGGGRDGAMTDGGSVQDDGTSAVPEDQVRFNTFKIFVSISKRKEKYRVTITLILNLQLSSRQKFRFGLTCPALARPKRKFCLEVNMRF